MKTRKLRLLSALLALAMLLALLPTAAFAETSNDYNYSIDSNGNVTITKYIGSGGTVVIPAEIGDKPVIAIGTKAFYGCSSVTAVTIPDSVESIGEDAFSGYADRSLETPRITEIKIPSGVKTIGNFAFAYCDELKTVDLSQAANLTTIGQQAFDGCKNLTDVKLNGAGNLQTIESGAFVRSGVTQIEIPASVEKIEARAFYKCPLQSVTFAEVSQLKTVGVKAFAETQLDSIVIPASVQTLESEEGFSPTGSSTNHWEGAFYRCGQLQSVTFKPDSQLTTVGKGTFDECSKLETISCESALKEKLSGVVDEGKISVTHWNVKFVIDANTTTKPVENNKPVAELTAPTKDGYIFAGWYTKDANDKWAENQFDFNTPIKNDMTLYARWNVGGNCGAEGDGSNVTWTLDSNGTMTISGTGAMKAYARVSDRPWRGRSADIITVVIGSEVTKIGSYAFAGCKNLKTVNLPENGKLEEIGYCAFGDRTVSDIGAPIITEITIPASVKVIDAYAFMECKELGTVTFASDSQLELINGWAFQETALTKITIPASITFFDGEAFKDCEKLEEVTFEAPSGLCEDKYNMSNTAFTGCTKLSKINCEAALQEKLASRLPADVKAKVVFNVTDATDSDSDADKDPETYPITIDYGTAYDAEGNPITKAAKGETVYVEASETALDGMTFERWEVRKGDVKLENDRAAKTSFTMPAGEVQLEAMYQAADVEDSGWDAATVVTGVAIGTGTAILAYHIGLEVYAEQVLGKDVAVPRTRAEVALLAWQLAGSPAVNVEGEPLSEAAQAQRWAVESGLMQKDAEGNFNGTKKMSKWNALRTLDSAKKLG